MTLEPGASFRIIDRRATAEDERPSELPAGYRAHLVLLGHLDEQPAREFLRDKGAHSGTVERLMEDWHRARSRLTRLPRLAADKAMRPVEDEESAAEIGRVMARPECRSAFPEGSWTAGLVEIAQLVPLHPNLDIDYAEHLGGPELDRSSPFSAVRLCFAEKHVSPFQVGVDQSQKSITVSSIHPAFEIVGLRCSQQEDDGPLVVSFMVSAPPPVVTVLHHAGRHFLLDGTHRVYRLMRAGFSHVPCIVRDAPGLAQLASRVPQVFPPSLLMAPRPPLFPDFAEPALGLTAPLRAMRRVIRLRPDEYLVAT